MSESLINELSKFKDTYYNENKKNIFQYKTQKYELAKMIASSFDINTLFNKTAYLIPNTNKLFVNYQIFKQFAEPGIYGLFIKHIQNRVNVLIDKYKTFECHIDIESFTVSAAERYKGLIDKFNEEVLCYTDYMDAIYIYNSPNMIETIYKVLSKFIDPPVRSKIILIKKSDSESVVAGFRECFST